MIVGVILKKDVYVVKPRGAYDRKMAAEIENKVYELIGRGAYKFVLDLKHVKGILSRGVHSLLEIYGRIKEAGGTVKLAGLRRDVKFVLEFSRLSEAFEIYPDQKAALESYGVRLLDKRQL
jgi:anti-anti-sigma factor